MKRQMFTWGASRDNWHRGESWLEFLCLMGLFLAAIVLLSLHLGNLPLLARNERITAQVAQEIWQAPLLSGRWLLPTLPEQPDLHPLPLLHGLIALSYAWAGSNAGTTRLPVALLSACSVPLLYSLGREIFATRLSALFSALIYLTLLPVACQGRLATPEGAALCFGILMVLCILRSRRDLRWAFAVGLSFSAISLTQAIMAWLFCGIALLFLAWDTPRLLKSVHFKVGVLLGSLPALGWYLVRWLFFGQPFLGGTLSQWLPLWEDRHFQMAFYYLIEILKGSFPWLIFAYSGTQLAWQHRHWGWAKLILVWGSASVASVSLIPLQLPEYLLPFYPALALAGGVALAERQHLPRECPYPRLWIFGLGTCACITGLLSLSLVFERYLAGINLLDPSLKWVMVALTLTLAMSVRLMSERAEEFMAVLFWGLYISLLLFVSSPYWTWQFTATYCIHTI